MYRNLIAAGTLDRRREGGRVGGMKKLLSFFAVALLLAGCGEQAQKEAVVEQWAEWEANPEPYGGLETLAKIRKAKESGTTRLDLSGNQITDVTPLAELTKLEWLLLFNNQIPDDQKEMLKKALPNCDISF